MRDAWAGRLMRAAPIRVGLYSDSAIVGGAERSLLNLVKAYRGPAELVVCSPSEALLSECASLLPDVLTHRISSRGSLAKGVLDHRRAFRGLQLNLLQVTLCNPFTARPALLAGYSLRIPTIAVEQLVLPAQRRRGRILKHATALPLAAHVAVGSASADDIHELFGIRRSSVTVIHNGVAVQNHFELLGNTNYDKPAAYEKHPLKQPIRLQNHGDLVKYRNIWLREIAPVVGQRPEK